MKTSGVSHVILGLLLHEPRSGYEIKRIVDRSTRLFWAASYGQIYPELERLAAAGLIEGSTQPRGKRKRNVYRLTAEGRGALRDWLVEPDVGLQLRDEGLLKLFFADALASEDRIDLVRRMRSSREEVLAGLRETERQGRARVGSSAHLVLRYGIEHYEWMVDWCSKTERQLARQAGAAEGGTK